jgi:hypothetical protein
MGATLRQRFFGTPLHFELEGVDGSLRQVNRVVVGVDDELAV